jgi:hypothetical protein
MAVRESSRYYKQQQALEPAQAVLGAMLGYSLRDEDVARLSPFIHERHINLLGCYSFAQSLEESTGHLPPTMQMLNRVLRSGAP